MFLAALAAITRYYAQCMSDPTLVDEQAFTPSDIRDSRDNIGDIYLVRMFADFEQTLRHCWQSSFRRNSHPMARVLVDSIAARSYVPADSLARVHEVRNYRNALVHGGELPPKVSLAMARGYLCRFMSYLPREW